MDRLWDGLEAGDISVDDSSQNEIDMLVEKIEQAFKQSVHNRRDILLMHLVIVKLVEEGVVDRETIVDMKRQVTDEVKEKYPEVFSD